MRVKITEGQYAGQEGEYVRDEGDKVVVLIPGAVPERPGSARYVEFDPAVVDMVVEPEADDSK